MNNENQQTQLEQLDVTETTQDNEQDRNYVFNRVKEWNIMGGKPAPEIDDPKFYDIVNNQLDRIHEECEELIEALHASDRLEQLDGICDLDVTINGLFFLTDYKPDKYSEFLTNRELQTYYPEDVTEDELVAVCNALLEAIQHFGTDVDYPSMYTALVILTEYAKHHFDYIGGINAVLDNNDAKFYYGDEGILAFDRAVKLHEMTSDAHRVEVTLADADGLDLGSLDLDDLIKRGAVFSVHRVFDDKICKPEDFDNVDLAPYLEPVKEI